jgi:polyhydroxyalkanoate synthesis regulator phasin
MWVGSSPLKVGVAMRAISVGFVTVALFSAATAHGGEKELFDKFKRQNEQSREKVKEDIKLVLEKAAPLEKDEPAKALLLLQITRDQMLAQGLLTAKEDRALVEPLLERIQLLRGGLRGKQADELRSAMAEFKEYLLRMHEEFSTVRQELLLPNREVPPGSPAFIQLTNGTQVVGWLHEPPVFVVNATVSDQQHTYAPGVVAGLQTPQGFYLYYPATKRFVLLPSAEFFVTAVAASMPARKSNFWIPTEIPPPPPGFYKRSTGVVGAALFARSAGALMTSWAAPGGSAPESIVTGRVSDPVAARLYRDVSVDLAVQELFPGLKKTDQVRFRDIIMTFLDRRPRDDPFSADEVVQLSDLIADIAPDRRTNAVAFAHVISRLFEQAQRLRKK